MPNKLVTFNVKGSNNCSLFKRFWYLDVKCNTSPEIAKYCVERKISRLKKYGHQCRRRSKKKTEKKEEEIEEHTSLLVRGSRKIWQMRLNHFYGKQVNNNSFNLLEPCRKTMIHKYEHVYWNITTESLQWFEYCG